jgi:hypothetical protein
MNSAATFMIYDLRFETSAKLIEQAIGAPSIARQIVEKAVSSSRAMLGVPVLQRSRFMIFQSLCAQIINHQS